jgi:hypothetical protein
LKVFFLLLVVLGGIHSMASAASWFAPQPPEIVIDRIERTIHGLPASLPETPPVVSVPQIITNIIPGLLTAISGALLAVITWLDNDGRRGEDPREFFASSREFSAREIYEKHCDKIGVKPMIDHIKSSNPSYARRDIMDALNAGHRTGNHGTPSN